ncbi:carbonyl reductase [NADPH] 1-like [Haliotis asinina]|uniref:carbonyl reductase [NADPH] 1-like n=1 Tax=Haliotis asinina TaxID=109174 RepID=UPI003531993C
MSSKLVAVVTGSNKGVGFGIARALCKQFDGDVILTARDVDRGQQAVADLNQEGLRPRFHQLDITDTDSVNALAAFLRDNYGGLDVLVNNAAIAYKGDSPAPFSEQARESVRCNFTGTLSVTRALMPLLRPHGRVVIVSSEASKRAMDKCSSERRAQFRDPSLTMEGLQSLMAEFVQDAASGAHQERGWPNTAYGVSKIGATVMSFILMRELAADPREDIIVNSCCPGHVDTDMSSHKGPLTIDQGADTPVFLALLPPGVEGPKGQFCRLRKAEDW